jgi:glycosyltransferase involved in cell wall biosynthesis
LSKIAIIGPAYPYRGGIAAYNELLAEQLQKDHIVKTYTFTLQYPSFLFPGKTQFSDETPPKNLTIERCINAVNPLNWFLIGKKIKKENYDIVIVRYWLPFMAPALGSIMRIVRKNINTKTLAIVDNMIPHEKRIGDKVFSNYFVNSVDHFLAMTKQVADDITLFNSNKPKIVSPHPLYDHFGERSSKNEALVKLKLSNEYKYILFFGLIRDYKGLDLLLKAFSKVDYKKLKLKLIIAGEYYSNKSQYDKLIDTLNLKDQIISHDYFIPDNEVANYFNAASVIAQPYITATQSGITQIAYHFNKPMIVTNVGGLPEMCPDGKVGFVVEPNPEAITEAINKFFSDNVDRFESNIIELKKQYSWSILVNNIFKLIN